MQYLCASVKIKSRANKNRLRFIKRSLYGVDFIPVIAALITFARTGYISVRHHTIHSIPASARILICALLEGEKKGYRSLSRRRKARQPKRIRRTRLFYSGQACFLMYNKPPTGFFTLNGSKTSFLRQKCHWQNFNNFHPLAVD